MKALKVFVMVVLLMSLATPTMAGPGNGGSGGKPGTEAETVGNNLSYPVIWSEGVSKALPGTPGMTPMLNGDYWYQWGTNGTDPDVVPASCPHDPDEAAGQAFCDDGIPQSLTIPAGTPAAQNPLPLARAYLQKTPGNTWQAWNGTATDAGVANALGGVDVDWIDWGDNLESVDWYTRSQVRTEVVLFKDVISPTVLLEYEMRHTSGWGIDEVHGMAADFISVPYLGTGTRATVYSPCARLIIQKMLVPRDSTLLEVLEWVPGQGWIDPEGYEENLINPPIFNKAVHEAADGPGYYNAEINVKGRIIYGYTWNVRTTHDDTPLAGSSTPTAAGDYRVTFSFDQQCGGPSLKTFFAEGTTEVIVPIEEEEATIAAEPVGGGATAVLVPAEYDEYGSLTGGNLTYIDVRILERDGGGNGGGGNGGKGARASALGGDLFYRQDQDRSCVGGECTCACEGDTCTCTCKEACDCECLCEGEQCNCNCMEQCDCDCACQDGVCDCACGAEECAHFQIHTQEMAQQHERLQTQCPGEGCPCIDHEGDACQQYQAQMRNTVKVMQQLRFRSECGDSECHCVCSGDTCQQARTQLETMLETKEQLTTQCQTGECEVESEFFASVSAALNTLADMLETMDTEFHSYLPSVQRNQ